LVVPIGDEYSYKPIEPEMSPPIGSNALLLLLKNPWKVAAKSTVLDVLPKRLYKDLHDCVWGIFFEECRDDDKIMLILGIGFIIPSFVLGVVWSALYDDLQSGFTIASWWTAVGAGFIGILSVLS
jgi:hypothetical protein